MTSWTYDTFKEYLINLSNHHPNLLVKDFSEEITEVSKQHTWLYPKKLYQNKSDIDITKHQYTKRKFTICYLQPSKHTENEIDNTDLFFTSNHPKAKATEKLAYFDKTDYINLKEIPLNTDDYYFGYSNRDRAILHFFYDGKDLKPQVVSFPYQDSFENKYPTFCLRNFIELKPPHWHHDGFNILQKLYSRKIKNAKFVHMLNHWKRWRSLPLGVRKCIIDLT
jgi:hypothetical protein